jgi:ABC-type glycerol-3-phosphate transport system permease component
VLSCIPVAYALSRMRWRGRRIAFLVVIATLMLPSQVTIVPLYMIFVRLHWVGSLKPLIVPAFFGDAFTIFLLRQFFQIMTGLIITLAKPAIMAVALFQFLYAWNDFFGPLLYTGNNPNDLDARGGALGVHVDPPKRPVEPSDVGVADLHEPGDPAVLLRAALLRRGSEAHRREG